MSEKSPNTKDAGAHFDSWPVQVQQAIREYIESKGFTVEGARTEYMVRDQLNIHYFKDFEKALPEWPWPYLGVKRQSFF